MKYLLFILFIASISAQADYEKRSSSYDTRRTKIDCVTRLVDEVGAYRCLIDRINNAFLNFDDDMERTSLALDAYYNFIARGGNNVTSTNNNYAVHNQVVNDLIQAIRNLTSDQVAALNDAFAH